MRDGGIERYHLSSHPNATDWDSEVLQGWTLPVWFRRGMRTAFEKADRMVLIASSFSYWLVIRWKLRSGASVDGQTTGAKDDFFYATRGQTVKHHHNV